MEIICSGSGGGPICDVVSLDFILLCATGSIAPAARSEEGTYTTIWPEHVLAR